MRGAREGERMEGKRHVEAVTKRVGEITDMDTHQFRAR